jgi:hypothetical protein
MGGNDGVSPERAAVPGAVVAGWRQLGWRHVGSETRTRAGRSHHVHTFERIGTFAALPGYPDNPDGWYAQVRRVVRHPEGAEPTGHADEVLMAVRLLHTSEQLKSIAAALD